MSLNIGPEYIVDKNTSFVLVDTLFPIQSTAVVYLSSVSIPGRIVSIKDSTGGLGPTKFITVSTSKDVLFANGTNSASFNAPYGFMTCTNQSPSAWTITNTYGFPTQSTPAYTLSLRSESIEATTISTNYLSLSTLTFANGTTPYKIFGSATLVAGTVTITTNYVNTNSLVFVQRTSLNGSTDIGTLLVTKGVGSFVITSRTDTGTIASDISSIDWIMFNPTF
jgi:hypothetical protein